MRAVVGLVFLALLAACSGPPATGSATPSGSASAAPPTAGPTASGTAGAVLGVPEADLEARLGAIGFVFEDATDVPGARRGTLEYSGEYLLVGDPVAAIGWRIVQPFMDNGPLHVLLEQAGLGEIAAWKDGMVPVLEATEAGGRAQDVIAGVPVLLAVERAAGEMTSMSLVVGDADPLLAWLPPEPVMPPTPAPTPPELVSAMDGYARLAGDVNAGLARELAIMLDGAPPSADRAAAAGRAAGAEAAFASGLRALAVPPAAIASRDALVAAAEASGSTLAEAAVGRADPDAVVAALDAVAAAATDLREALLAWNVTVGSWWAYPQPAINPGAVVAAPGELQEAEHGLSLENGDGTLVYACSNPWAAFAFDVAVDVKIWSYEGPLVETRRVVVAMVPPGGVGRVVEEIVGLRPPGLTPQRLEPTIVGVGAWRAIGDLAILGR